jgi:hypothetical protein
MIRKLTLLKDQPFIIIQQEAPFQKINFISAYQLEGVVLVKPVIMISVGEGANVFSSPMNLNPLTNTFSCVDVLATIRKMNVLPEFKGNILNISINENYYQGQFCIELELDIE